MNLCLPYIRSFKLILYHKVLYWRLETWWKFHIFKHPDKQTKWCQHYPTYFWLKLHIDWQQPEISISYLTSYTRPGWWLVQFPLIGEPVTFYAECCNQAVSIIFTHLYSQQEDRRPSHSGQTGLMPNNQQVTQFHQHPFAVLQIFTAQVCNLHHFPNLILSPH